MGMNVFTRPAIRLRTEELAKALATYRFVGRDTTTGKLNTILHVSHKPFSLRTLTVPQYPDSPLKGTLIHLTEGEDVFTAHQYIGPGQFQPLVAEVLAQIPSKYHGVATHIQVLGATEIHDWNCGLSRWVGQLRLYRLQPDKPKAPPRKRKRA